MLKRKLLILLIMFCSIAGYAQITPQYRAVAGGLMSYFYSGKSPAGFDTLWNAQTIRGYVNNGVNPFTQYLKHYADSLDANNIHLTGYSNQLINDGIQIHNTTGDMSTLAINGNGIRNAFYEITGNSTNAFFNLFGRNGLGIVGVSSNPIASFNDANGGADNPNIIFSRPLTGTSASFSSTPVNPNDAVRLQDIGGTLPPAGGFLTKTVADTLYTPQVYSYPKIFKNALGQGITYYGDSITWGQGGTTPTVNGYAYVLGGYIGGTITNNAVPGNTVLQQNVPLLQTAPLSTSRTGYAYYAVGINDIRGTDGSDQVKIRYPSRGATNFMITAFGNTPTLAPSLTSFGSWTTSNLQSLCGAKSNGIKSTTLGDSVVYTITDADNFYFFAAGGNNGVETMAYIKVLVDNVQVDNINIYTGYAVPNAYIDLGFVYHLNKGPHTIKLINNGVNGSGSATMIVDCIGTLKSPQNCAPAIVSDIYQTLPSQFQTGNPSVTNAANQFIHDQVGVFRSWGYPAISYTVSDFYNPINTVDGIHPNDAGHLQIADGAFKVINNQNKVTQLYVENLAVKNLSAFPVASSTTEGILTSSDYKTFLSSGVSGLANTSIPYVASGLLAADATLTFDATNKIVVAPKVQVNQQLFASSLTAFPTSGNANIFSTLNPGSGTYPFSTSGNLINMPRNGAFDYVVATNPSSPVTRMYIRGIDGSVNIGYTDGLTHTGLLAVNGTAVVQNSITSNTSVIAPLATINNIGIGVQNTAVTGTNAQIGYSSTGGSGVYPFTSNGNFVVSPRNSNASDVVIMTGTTPAVRAIFSGTGTYTFSGLSSGLIKSTSGLLGTAVSNTDYLPITSPVMVTPTLGVATATSINKVAITAPSTSATLTIANGKTLTVNNTLTLAGTDATTMTFPTTSATIARTDAANTFTGIQSFASNPVFNTTSVVGQIWTATNTSGSGNWATTNYANLIVGTPTIVAGTGAGTSPTVSVTSNGRGLQVTVTTGTLPTGTNATVATVTLANALTYTPIPVFSSGSASTSLLNGASMIYMTSSGTSNVTITSGTTALTAATTYVWNIAL